MKHTASLLVVASLAAGCAGSSSARGGYAYAPSSGYRASAAPAVSATSSSASGAYRSQVTVPSEVSASQPAYDAAPAPPESPRGGAVDVPAEARPGLATEWGEARRSSMSYAPFVRASSQPFDLAAIHYNDAHLAAMQAIQHQGSPMRWVGAGRDGIRISLRDDAGDALPGYRAGDTVYVLGNAGQRYTILLENTTAARFEAVVSVDGLDVINGRPASGSSRGYILPAYGRVEIEGFRQSLDAVATFRFGAVGDSYAAQTGDARNVGVIGVALFAERGAVLDLEQNEIELRRRANPFPGGFSAPPPRTYY